eukprot:PITA_06501
MWVILHDQGLPLHLWAKECNTAVYVHNPSAHQILEMKTREEAYSSKRPNVGHFRIFGSSVYFHVMKDARKKVEEPHIDVEKQPTEDLGLETSTQVESSREGRKCTREADRLLDDARENVGEPTSQRRQRRSRERYTRYLALMGECVVTKPSSFKEVVQQPVWVDAMVEEYDSVVCNSVLDVVPRSEDMLVMSSCWLYKVKKATDGSVEKNKVGFVSHVF